MRIAFITETFLPATDGVVTRLRHTIKELRRMGDEILIIAPKYGEGPGFYEGAPIYRVPAVPFPPYPQIKLAPALPGVGHALMGFKPDLIHAVNPVVLGLGAPYFARRLDVPLVASYHTNIAQYTSFYKLGFLTRAARWYTKRLHNLAEINLCTSMSTAKYLESEGIKSVRVWPQGVDTERFAPKKGSEWWRNRLSGGHPDENLLLYVGRLAPEKDIGRLKRVLERLPGTRLAIVGDGPARRDLENEFAGTPTTFPGLLLGEELAAAYASADAFVFPSTTETLGMAMIEALASGLPVIAARGGATHEVVADGEEGFLYEPDDDGSLVKAARRIFEEDDLRERLSSGARNSAEERDWASSTRALKSYYEEAVGSKAVG
ncbi:MAG: glycosyltransferase family 4 protein [Rubrobacteraceae bacterium]